MAIFRERSKQLLLLNAMMAVVVFSLGLAPPSQSSGKNPTSVCAAPSDFHAKVTLLQHTFLLATVASCYLASCAVTGEGRGKDTGKVKIAIGLSAVAAGHAIAVSTYQLQIRFMVFACMPSGVRSLALAAEAMMAAVCIYSYGHFVMTVISSGV